MFGLRARIPSYTFLIIVFSPWVKFALFGRLALLHPASESILRRIDYANNTLPAEIHVNWTTTLCPNTVFTALRKAALHHFALAGVYGISKTVVKYDFRWMCRCLSIFRFWWSAAGSTQTPVILIFRNGRYHYLCAVDTILSHINFCSASLAQKCITANIFHTRVI